ncbi:hypothetical protein HXV90_02850 [Lysinibacillus sp. JK80]|uniref:hypothetical protein n=1 Tax=Lysinibacillus sp. JK80 TaxID=2749809 RepID=UPI0022B997C7|nr:hypothetical protein [Lysinibacillus sp. JK80]WBF54867.1 hypothetical protein HXV90_02850 [Lysinibacillus sp. JK80]
MNFFYTNLNSIYESEDSLKLIMPFESLHLYLRDFFLNNLKKKAPVIDPLDFSFRYKIDTLKTINLFLTLSNYGLLKKLYQLECDECNEIAFEDSIENFYECFVCKHPLLNLSEPSFDKLFNNISYAFEFCDELQDELYHDLKVPPSLSSNKQSDDKGGDITTIQSNFSVSDVLKHTDVSMSSITSEQCIIKQQIDDFLAKGIKTIS